MFVLANFFVEEEGLALCIVRSSIILHCRTFLFFPRLSSWFMKFKNSSILSWNFNLTLLLTKLLYAFCNLVPKFSLKYAGALSRDSSISIPYTSSFLPLPLESMAGSKFSWTWCLFHFKHRYFLEIRLNIITCQFDSHLSLKVLAQKLELSQPLLVSLNHLSDFQL